MTRLSFTEHPGSVGESYLEHALNAASFGVHMLVGGLVCLVHAVVPFLFVQTGSRIVATLYQRMVTHRTAGQYHAAVAPTAAERPAKPSEA